MLRRCSRFRVRSLFLVMALTCCYLAFTAHRVQQRQQASRELKELGGQADQSADEPSLGAWLQGKAFAVRRVHFLGPRVGDHSIEAIVAAASNLPELTSLSFTETRITRDGERALKAKLPDIKIEVMTPVFAPRSMQVPVR